jgi:hypothetical protein
MRPWIEGALILAAGACGIAGGYYWLWRTVSDGWFGEQ